MKVQKQAAVALFVALGLKNADKWNDDRLAAKLGKIKEMVDEDVKLEGDEQDLLKQVMAAAAAGEGFEIEGAAAEVEGEPKAEKASKAKQTDEDKAAAKAAKEKEKADAKAAKEKEKADAKAAKEKEKAEKAAAKAKAKAEREAARAAGKRAVPRKMIAGGKGNHEFSGQVLAEFGLGGEITQAMCDRHCELRGKVNDDAVDYLTIAWKIITAYNTTLAAKSVG